MEKQGSYEINFMNDLPLFAMVKKKADAPVPEPEETVPPEFAQVIEKLSAIDPDSMTPREALDALYALKKMMQ